MDPDDMFRGIIDDDPIPLPGPEDKKKSHNNFRVAIAVSVIASAFVIVGIVLTIAAFDVFTYKVIGPLVLCGGVVLLIVGAVLFFVNREKEDPNKVPVPAVPAGYVQVGLSTVAPVSQAFVVPPYQNLQQAAPVPVIQVTNSTQETQPSVPSVHLIENHTQDRTQPTPADIEGATIASSGSHSSLTDLANINTDSGTEAPDTDGFFGLVKRRTRSFYVGGIHPQTNLAGMQKFFATKQVKATYIKLFKCKAGNRLGAQVDVVKSDAHKLLENDMWPPGVYCKKWVNWKKITPNKIDDENKPLKAQD